MENKRKYSRTKLKSKCSLVVNDGDAQPASLDDISFGGVLVEVHSDAEICVGDICQLELSLNTAERPIKRTGKIVRQDSKKVGVKFTP